MCGEPANEWRAVAWLGGIYERERAGKKKKKECHRRRKAKAFYSFFSLSL
jgi:hypothetical protein